MVCFADPDPVATDGQIAILMFLATAAGSAIQWLIGKGFEWWREKRGERAAGQATIVTHLQALVTRLDAEKEELAREKEEESLARQRESDKNSRCKISAAGMRRHIRYLELTLTRAKVVFVPFEEEPEEDASDVHKPLGPVPDESPPIPGQENQT
jgi:hypothetical protein